MVENTCQDYLGHSIDVKMLAKFGEFGAVEVLSLEMKFLSPRNPKLAIEVDHLKVSGHVQATLG